MKVVAYQCPVCGYANLDEPAADITGEPTYAICPSCGTQFGADDRTLSHAELRAAWVGTGSAWWSEAKPAPLGWDASTQLRAAGFSAAGDKDRKPGPEDERKS